jgi:hypothetical protein
MFLTYYSQAIILVPMLLGAEKPCSETETHQESPANVAAGIRLIPIPNSRALFMTRSPAGIFQASEVSRNTIYPSGCGFGIRRPNRRRSGHCQPSEDRRSGRLPHGGALG